MAFGSLKMYIIKKKLKQLIGVLCSLICGFIAIFIGGVGLIFGDLSTVNDIQCKWNKQVNMDSYQTQCKNNENNNSNDYCKTRNAGLTFLIGNIIAILFCAFGMIVVLVKKRYAGIPFFISWFANLIGVLSWVINNPICWNVDSSQTKSLGATYIISIVTLFMFFIAWIFSMCRYYNLYIISYSNTDNILFFLFYRKTKKGYTLLPKESKSNKKKSTKK